MPVTYDGDRDDAADLHRFYRGIRNAPWQQDPPRFLQDPLNALRFELILDQVRRLAPRSLLDVGCGAGTLLGLIAQTQPETFVCGADLNPAGAGSAPVFAADACALPLPDASFHCMICSETLEHLPAPEAALSEFHRILKPGGHLLVTVPNLFCLDSIEGRLHVFESMGRALHLAGISSRWKNGINTHLQKMSPRQWSRALTSQGFAIRDMQPIYVFPYVPYFFGPAKTLEQALFRIPGVKALQSAADRACTHLPVGQLHFFLCESI